MAGQLIIDSPGLRNKNSKIIRFDICKDKLGTLKYASIRIVNHIWKISLFQFEIFRLQKIELTSKIQSLSIETALGILAEYGPYDLFEAAVLEYNTNPLQGGFSVKCHLFVDMRLPSNPDRRFS